MRVLLEIRTGHDELRLVEGTVEILHEIPLRNSIISILPGFKSLHSVSVILSSGRSERIAGEIDLALFQEGGRTWLHTFEFKTSLLPRKVIEQMSRARMVADLLRLWLEGRGVRPVSWSYTVLVRRSFSEADRERLRREEIGVIGWDELATEGRKVMGKIIGRDIAEITRLGSREGRAHPPGAGETVPEHRYSRVRSRRRSSASTVHLR